MTKKIIILAILILLVIFSGWLAFYYYHKTVAETGISQVPPAPGKNDWLSYNDARYGFTIQYPPNFEFNLGGLFPSQWVYFDSFPGEKILSLTISRADYASTTLAQANINIAVSRDSRAVVGCLKPQSGLNESQKADQVIKGITFKQFTSAGAGAGNYYETISFRTIRDNDLCYALEITIHSTNLANYPPEFGIKEFDRQKVITELMKILQTFKFREIDQSLIDQSGIIGKVILGPNCPVLPANQTEACADKPFKTTLVIKTAAGTNEVARTQSDDEGFFKIVLPPGNYQIGGEDVTKYPIARPETVTVGKAEFVSILVYFDTGIR